MGCFAMTETGHGSNVQALGTVATYDAEAEEFVITTPDDASRKDYIGNAAAPRRARRGLRPARGRRRAPRRARVRRADPRGRRGCCPAYASRTAAPRWASTASTTAGSGSTACGCRATALLNQFADVTPEGGYLSPIDNPNQRFFTMLGTLVQGRVCVGGAGINAAKVALTIAIRYAVRRRQFEATSPDEEELLLDYGMHQRRLFPLLARTYALHFAQEVVAGQLHDGLLRPRADRGGRRRARPPELESRAAGTKALGTWHATRTIQECREACGGAGYLSENRFAALKADTDVFTTFEGDNHVLLQLVAKGLLTDYAGEFEDMDQFGMVRFVAGLAVETVVERTSVHKLVQRSATCCPAATSGTRRPGLLDPNYQLAMLRFREEHMLGGVARRLKRGIDQGMNPGEVFSRVQDHVIARGPRARRAAGARGVRREDRRARPTATSRSPSTCSATCTRSPRSRPTGPGSWSTAGSRAPAPRRSAARSTPCAARSARSPSTSSTRSACPRRCCAARGADRLRLDAT